MSRFRAIFLRELRGLANSSVGWLCLVAFNLVAGAVFFYRVPPWSFNAVDLNPGFLFYVPIYLLVLVPILALRIWADEFRGTMELLLTLPVSVTEVVLAKYAALLAFLALLLASTSMLPLSLYWLGAPDFSAILAGYLALFFLGALFLAIGLFFASVTDTPVPGALFTFAACVLIFALGFPTWLALMPPGLDVICDRIAVYSAFTEIAAGRLSLPGLAYFLSAISFFLALTVLRLLTYKWSQPLSPPARRYTLPALAGFFALVMALWTLNLFLRAMQYDYVDLTGNREFTLSDATLNMLDKLPQPVMVRAYFSESVPAERQIPMAYARTVLNNYRRAGHGKFQLEFIDPAHAPKAVHDIVDHYGINQMMSQREGEGETTRQSYYCSILLVSGEQSELVPIDFSNLGGLEEQLTLATRSVVETELPRIVVLENHAGSGGNQPAAERAKGDPQPTQATVLALRDSNRYRVDWLSFGAAIPPHTRLVIVHDPVDMSYSTAYQLQEFVRSGGSLILCGSSYETPEMPEKRLYFGDLPVAISRRATGAEALLDGWGLRFEKGVAADRLSARVVILPEKMAARVANPTMRYSLLLSATGPNLNDESPLVHGLNQVFLDYPTPIQLKKSAPTELTYQWLVKTSPESRLLTDEHIPIQPWAPSLSPNEHGGEQYTLAYFVHGAFPTVLETPPPDKILPCGTPDGAPFDGKTARPGSLLVVGSPSLLHGNWVYTNQGYREVDPSPGNQIGLQNFLLRAIHRMAGANDLMDLSNKHGLARPVTRWTNREAADRISGQNLLAAIGTFFPALLWLLLGTIHLRRRLARSAAVELAVPAQAGREEAPPQ